MCDAAASKPLARGLHARYVGPGLGCGLRSRGYADPYSGAYPHCDAHPGAHADGDCSAPNTNARAAWRDTAAHTDGDGCAPANAAGCTYSNVNSKAGCGYFHANPCRAGGAGAQDPQGDPALRCR